MVRSLHGRAAVGSQRMRPFARGARALPQNLKPFLHGAGESGASIRAMSSRPRVALSRLSQRASERHEIDVAATGLYARPVKRFIASRK